MVDDPSRVGKIIIQPRVIITGVAKAISIGEKCKAIRDFYGLTQTKLASKIGCSQGHVCFIEKGGQSGQKVVVQNIEDLYAKYKNILGDKIYE